MGRRGDIGRCQVCDEQLSKYRCPVCPVRYCSVDCFRAHKTTCGTSKTLEQSSTSVSQLEEGLLQRPKPGMQEDDLDIDVAPSRDITTRKTQPLKPLTQLLWPPEPDPSIFSDPLKKEDPKPLRHEELLRIATSQQLRYLLSSTSLSNILRIADSIPSPGARASTLSRLLGLDPHSLSRPDNPLLSQRDSPPPLEDLLKAFAGEAQDDNVGWSEEGWWLGRDGTEHGRVWIGEEERKLMRLFAGIVCKAIDGGEGDEVAWGTGGLAWEV